MPRGGHRKGAGRPTTVDTESRREAFRKYVPEAKLKAIIEAQADKAIQERDTAAAKLILDGRFGPDVQKIQHGFEHLSDAELIAEATGVLRGVFAPGAEDPGGDDRTS